MFPIKNEQSVLVKRAINRAASGLYFLEKILDLVHTGGTDAAFSRSVYILLSFNFELILKSRLILARTGGSPDALLKGIKSHDLEMLSKELSESELRDIFISSIRKRQNAGFVEYEIETTEGRKIVVQDLVDVRYDFEKDSLRDSDPNEAARIKEEIEVLLKMVRKIRESIY